MIKNVALWIITNIPTFLYVRLPLSVRTWYCDAMFERDGDIPF